MNRCMSRIYFGVFNNFSAIAYSGLTEVRKYPITLVLVTHNR